MALSIVGAVYASGYVKNKVMEFVGPGVKKLPIEYRSAIDVMTTETTCWSSIWTTDEETKRYRSNCINWGMVPFLVKDPEAFALGDYIFIPGVRKAMLENKLEFTAYVVKPDGKVAPIQVSTGPLTDAERQIIADGCLINYYRANQK